MAGDRLLTAVMRWRFLLPLSVLLGFWLLLTGGNLESLVIGLPAVSAAFWAWRRGGDADQRLPSLFGMIYFLPYFLWNSVRGGLDVAWRTLGPRLRVQPGFYRYTTHLADGRARLLFANCVSLLPGTLTADLHENRLEVHVLDAGTSPLSDLQELERVVGRVFPNSLPREGQVKHA